MPSPRKPASKDAAPRRRDREIKYDVTQGDVDNAINVARIFGANVPHLVDEFESAAVYALYDAARGFDPTLGHSFRTYAYRVVVGAIQDTARSWRPKGFKRSPDAPVVTTFSAVELEDGASPEPEADDEAPVGWELERSDEVRGLARRLPPTLQGVFLATFEHATQAAAGRATGVSESRVSQVVSEATATLRARFAGLHCEEDLIMAGTNGVVLDAPRYRDRGIEGDGPPRKAPPAAVSKPMQYVPPPEPPAPAPAANPCPDCGNPRHPVNNRCYHCRPGGGKGKARAARPAADSPPPSSKTPKLVRPAAVPAVVAKSKTPAAATTPADLLGRELDAVRVVYDALAALPEESAAWVLQSVSRHYPPHN